MRGQYHWDKRRLPDLLLAAREFKAAMDKDPLWPLPYAGLAETYLALSGNELWSPEDGYPKARAAALSALKLDGDLPSARTALGFVKAFYEADWHEAEVEFRQAISVDPGYTNAHYWSGMVAMNVGDFETAGARIRHASSLSPLSPVIAANIGRPLLCARRFHDALACFEKALDLDPDFWVAHVFTGWAYEGLGRYQEALNSFAAAERVAEPMPGVIADIAHARACAGERQAAETLLSELIELARRRYVPPVRIARIYAGLGEPEQALGWLERACLDRSIRNNTYLAFDYAFDLVSDLPRFRRMLKLDFRLPSEQKR